MITFPELLTLPVSLRSSSFGPVDMRRVMTRPVLMGAAKLDNDFDCGIRDATECRREMVAVAAAAATSIGIDGGISALPNFSHALGIVSYK